MIYVTGDVHGQTRGRFDSCVRRGNISLTSDDYIVICGDWGGVWSNEEDDAQTIAQLEWMNSLGCKWIVLLGNHDNYHWAFGLEPVDEGFGMVRVAEYADTTYDNVYIIAKPTVLTMNGETCLCIPGAECHDSPHFFQDNDGNWHSKTLIYHPDKDCYSFLGHRNLKAYNFNGHPILSEIDRINEDYQLYYMPPDPYRYAIRTEGTSWWPQEAVDVDSTGEIVHTLIDNECHVDYIFSHDAPAIQLQEQSKKLPNGHKERQTVGQLFLDDVRSKLDFDEWYHGHLHWDRLVPQGDNRVCCLFGTILNLSTARIIGEDIDE